MLLAIDVGNTNLKMSLLDESTGKLVGETERLDSKNPDGTTLIHKPAELDRLLVKICHESNVDRKSIRFAIFVTVVGGSSSYLTEFCNSILKSDQFLEVGYKNVPITTLVPHPGPDRVVTAIAAARKFGTESGPMLVLDFGTATTFDLVEVANNKLIISSGIIAIGPITMKNGFTRAIPGLKNKYNFNKDVRVLEMDVISQVSSGAYHGYLGMICGLIDGSLSELLAKNRLHTSEKLNLVITGGPSQIFENGLKVRYRNHDHVTFVSRENDLMMEGLFCIYEFNKALRHLQSQQMKNVANQNSVQTEGLQSKL